MRSGIKALLGALALAACGRSGSTIGGHSQHGAGGDPGASPALPVTPPIPSVPVGPGDCAGGVVIRLVGITPGNVSALQLTPSSARVLGPDGSACPDVGADTGPLDLSTDAVAHDVATFRCPPAAFQPGGAPLGVRVSFQGGTATVAATTGPLALCGPSLAFSFDPSRVDRTRCSVTVLLDVGRSVLPTATGLTFLPQYRVFF
jgi:hypothetical protein